MGENLALYRNLNKKADKLIKRREELLEIEKKYKKLKKEMVKG